MRTRVVSVSEPVITRVEEDQLVFEITVKISKLQVATPTVFRVGDRVRILNNKGSSLSDHYGVVVKVCPKTFVVKTDSGDHIRRIAKNLKHERQNRQQR